MAQQLTTQNATITTVAVQVKAITISGRQVTQSVYRQLREEPLAAYDGTLNGIPWGIVNHCPERKFWDSARCEWLPCSSGLGHLHVVWQNGDQLRRARVTPPPGWWPRYWSDWTDAYAQARYCANEHRMPEGLSVLYGSRNVAFQFGRAQCEANHPESTRTDGHECSGHEIDACHDELLVDLGREDDRRNRHKASWLSVKQLPQLFIAV
ncbi:hypothetical protein ACIBL5_00475 [Streptomyces sp. NPDC050516]|uniref:hypothetical protein n=1 Tax=Streptomyces sp. NPDC050516 TaxID=3365621 RepID=UPI00378C3BAB